MTRMYNSQEAIRRSPSYRIKIGQRFHQVGYTSPIWQAMSVYHDALGVEHAILMEAGRLGKRTLSAAVLLDRSQYQLIGAARGAVAPSARP